MTLPLHKKLDILSDLGDWLLEDGSVSFSKLDSFRTALSMSSDRFCKVLGISSATYRKYKRNGVNRHRKQGEKMCEGVSEYLRRSSSSVDPLEQPLNGSFEGPSDSITARLNSPPRDRFKYGEDDAAQKYFETLTSSRTTPLELDDPYNLGLYVKLVS